MLKSVCATCRAWCCPWLATEGLGIRQVLSAAPSMVKHLSQCWGCLPTGDEQIDSSVSKNYPLPSQTIMPATEAAPLNTSSPAFLLCPHLSIT